LKFNSVEKQLPDFLSQCSHLTDYNNQNHHQPPGTSFVSVSDTTLLYPRMSAQILFELSNAHSFTTFPSN